MEILSGVIMVVGMYLLAYSNHCNEVARHMKKCEEEAAKEDVIRTERKIRKLHSKGCVFNEGL